MTETSEPQAVPLKGPCTDLLGLNPSEFQHRSSRLKGIRDIWGGTELSGIRTRAGGGSFLTDRSASIGYFSFSAPAPQSYKASRWAAYLRLHQPGSYLFPHPGDSLRPCPTQLLGPSNLFPMAFPYEWLVLAHASDFSKFSQTSI